MLQPNTCTILGQALHHRVVITQMIDFGISGAASIASMPVPVRVVKVSAINSHDFIIFFSPVGCHKHLFDERGWDRVVPVLSLCVPLGVSHQFL